MEMQMEKLRSKLNEMESEQEMEKLQLKIEMEKYENNGKDKTRWNGNLAGNASPTQ